MNVLIPMAGPSVFYEETTHHFPKPLLEINGKPMIQWVTENLSSITTAKQFIFLVKRADCERFYLDNTIRLLLGDRAKIIPVEGETKGAACSCLLAINLINTDEPLLISNGDQIITHDLNAIISNFETEKWDGGLVCVDSVHPKWSYALTDHTGKVIQTAEKEPISRNAIAGLYYFKKGKDFVESSFRMIRKNVNTNGNYFIAPSYNEMILQNRRVGIFRINTDEYFSFYSPKKMQEFEKQITK